MEVGSQLVQLLGIRAQLRHTGEQGTHWVPEGRVPGVGHSRRQRVETGSRR